jgi:hypothetical protein
VETLSSRVTWYRNAGGRIYHASLAGDPRRALCGRRLQAVAFPAPAASGVSRVKKVCMVCRGTLDGIKAGERGQ